MANTVALASGVISSNSFDKWKGCFVTCNLSQKKVKELCQSTEVKFQNISKSIFSGHNCTIREGTFLSSDNFEWHESRPLSYCKLKDGVVKAKASIIPNKSKLVITNIFDNNKFIFPLPNLSCIQGKGDRLFFSKHFSKKICLLPFGDGNPKFSPINDPVKTFATSISEVECLEVGEQYLIGGCLDGSINLWNIETGEHIDHLISKQYPDHSITALCANEEFLVSGDNGGRLKLWELHWKQWLDTYGLSTSKIERIVVDPPFLYVMPALGDIHVLYIKDNKLNYLKELKIDGIGCFRNIAMQEGRLAVASSNGKLCDEVNFDFGSRADLETTLRYIAETLRKPYKSKLYTRDRFDELEEDVRDRIYDCMSKILLNAKVPNYSPDKEFTKRVIDYGIGHPDSEFHDKQYSFLADAIEMYLRELFIAKRERIGPDSF